MQVGPMPAASGYASSSPALSIAFLVLCAFALNLFYI
jgi:hypothetical protein